MNSKKQPIDIFELIATCFYIGKICRMPGTFGSLLALPFWLFITIFFKICFVPYVIIYIFWAIFLIALLFLGSHCSTQIEEKTRVKDQGFIIIDEVLGQLISLVLTQHLVINSLSLNNNHNLKIYGIFFLLNLAFFRIFDILKPSIIGICDKKIKGGIGVMADDVAAGIISGVLINSIYYLMFLLN